LIRNVRAHSANLSPGAPSNPPTIPPGPVGTGVVTAFTAMPDVSTKKIQKVIEHFPTTRAACIQTPTRSCSAGSKSTAGGDEWGSVTAQANAGNRSPL